MRILIYLWTVMLLTNCATSAQIGDRTVELIQCQQNWNYQQLDKEIFGTIYFYEQPTYFCGQFANASVALIVTETSDTVRVLTLCHMKSRGDAPQFLKGDKVTAQPDKKPSFKINLIPYDPKTCTLKKAYFGTITATK